MSLPGPNPPTEPGDYAVICDGHELAIGRAYLDHRGVLVFKERTPDNQDWRDAAPIPVAGVGAFWARFPDRALDEGIADWEVDRVLNRATTP